MDFFIDNSNLVVNFLNLSAVFFNALLLNSGCSLNVIIKVAFFGFFPDSVELVLFVVVDCLFLLVFADSLVVFFFLQFI